MLAGLEDSEYGQAHAEELLAMAAPASARRTGRGTTGRPASSPLDPAQASLA